MRNIGCLVIFWSTVHILFAQVERIYDEAGHLRRVNPINLDGLYDGTGMSYYPSGVIEAEIPYQGGEIDGVLRRYWPDGTLRMEQHYRAGLPHGFDRSYHPNGVLEREQQWRDGQREGMMRVQDTLGRLRLLAWSYHDSLVFAQRFDVRGALTHEKLGKWGNLHLDTTALMAPRVFVAEGQPLRADTWYRVQAFVPGVPTQLMRVNCQGCATFEAKGHLPYPLRLVPEAGRRTLTLYLSISRRPGAAPVLLRSVQLVVDSS